MVCGTSKLTWFVCFCHQSLPSTTVTGQWLSKLFCDWWNDRGAGLRKRKLHITVEDVGEMGLKSYQVVAYFKPVVSRILL